jgi:predicted GNAT family acetyltransferase
MRNFRRYTIFVLNRLISNGAISARHQYHRTWCDTRGAGLLIVLPTYLHAVLGALDVLALKAPVDTVYGELRARLEHAGHSVGANDLLVATQWP